LVLAGVTDPGNAGTIIRSAAAFGFQVIAAGTGVDLWSPKVVRAGAGAHFAIRITEMAADPTAPLEQLGIIPVAMVAMGGGDIDDLPSRPVALLVGSEPHGLPEALARSCDLRLTLEMGSATESLNASVAASIAMWARLRSRSA
jgi:TrmH family RNA methyltransferase